MTQDFGRPIVSFPGAVTLRAGPRISAPNKNQVHIFSWPEITLPSSTVSDCNDKLLWMKQGCSLRRIRDGFIQIRVRQASNCFPRIKWQHGALFIYLFVLFLKACHSRCSSNPGNTTDTLIKKNNSKTSQTLIKNLLPPPSPRMLSLTRKVDIP